MLPSSTTSNTSPTTPSPSPASRAAEIAARLDNGFKPRSNFSAVNGDGKLPSVGAAEAVVLRDGRIYVAEKPMFADLLRRPEDQALRNALSTKGFEFDTEGSVVRLELGVSEGLKVRYTLAEFDKVQPKGFRCTDGWGTLVKDFLEKHRPVKECQFSVGELVHYWLSARASILRFEPTASLTVANMIGNNFDVPIGVTGPTVQVRTLQPVYLENANKLIGMANSAALPVLTATTGTVYSGAMTLAELIGHGFSAERLFVNHFQNWRTRRGNPELIRAETQLPLMEVMAFLAYNHGFIQQTSHNAAHKYGIHQLRLHQIVVPKANEGGTVFSCKALRQEIDGNLAVVAGLMGVQFRGS